MVAGEGCVGTDLRRQVHAFGEMQGPRTRIHTAATPRYLLDLFLDFGLLVTMINKNAEGKRQAEHHSGTWHPFDITEIDSHRGEEVS